MATVMIPDLHNGVSSIILRPPPDPVTPLRKSRYLHNWLEVNEIPTVTVSGLYWVFLQCNDIELDNGGSGSIL